MNRRLLFELQYLLRKARWDTGISPPELIAFLERHPPGHALDLGCGTGTNAITIHQYGWDVVGIDISALAIQKARRKAKHARANIRFIRGDILALQALERHFDLILDIGCFHALQPACKEIYANNIHKYLQPNGTFLLYTWLQQDLDGDPTLSVEEKLLKLFNRCCQCIKIARGADWASHHSSAWITFKRVQ